MSTEAIWSGDFGNEYTLRNDKLFASREAFFGPLIQKYKINSILEVGCNVGRNLELVSKYIMDPVYNVWGIDVNQQAIRTAQIRGSWNAAVASGYRMPFKDDCFDLVFTCGVLIHQLPGEVQVLMQEVIRVSGMYILALEYGDSMFREIPYRGIPNSLFKGPFGEVYEKRYGLRMVETGKLGKKDGFDDVDYWMLAKYI